VGQDILVFSELHRKNFNLLPMNYSILSRSYDLRGIYGTDIDEDFFFRLGYAWTQVIGKKKIAL
jgi:phosphomannomutase